VTDGEVVNLPEVRPDFGFTGGPHPDPLRGATIGCADIISGAERGGISDRESGG
jgi:hypothetical protein